MNYMKLAEERKSIRSFKKIGVSENQKKEINRYFENSKHLVPQIDVELLELDSDRRPALENCVGYQGLVIGAPYYLILMSEIKDGYLENAGYICEELILKLTDMGLDNCWLTIQDKELLKKNLGHQSDKVPVSVIAYGYGKPERDAVRLDIKSPSDVKFNARDGHVAPKIKVEEMVYLETWGKETHVEDELADKGLQNAFYAASLAPAFLNRQPYRMIWDGHTVVLVSIKDSMTDEFNDKLNCGAVMRNFAAVLSERRTHDTKWILQEPDKKYELPNEARIVGYCMV